MRKIETYGFKSPFEPKRPPETHEFTEKIVDLVQNLEFYSKGTSKDEFQTKLASDVKEIKRDEKMYISADKTTNIYKMNPNTYNQLVDQNIQKDYKKTSIEEAKKITKTEQKIAQNLDLADRIEVSSKSEAYCTLKGTKVNFKNSPKCPLINPNKGKIGIVSKPKKQKLNNKIRIELTCNQ